MTACKVGTSGKTIVRRNIWIEEAAWQLLKQRADANGLSPSEEVSELILDAEYEEETAA